MAKNITSAKTKYAAAQAATAEGDYRTADPMNVVAGYAVVKKQVERLMGAAVDQLQGAVDSGEYDTSSVTTMESAITALEAVVYPDL